MQEFEFYNRLEKYMKENPTLRKGQAAYNLMFSLFPEIVKSIDEKDDPFYNDSKSSLFISKCLTKGK